MADNPHKGHRARMKQQFLENGLDGFNDHQVLEMLLFYAIAQKDTNELAHRLIDRFGGLSNVLDAEPRDLCDVNGISEHTATFLTFCRSLLNRYYKEKVKGTKRFTSFAAIGEYLQSLYVNERHEKVTMLCLDNSGKLLTCRVINEGTLTSVELDTRRIVQTALQHGATAAVLAHNHPVGIALPSEEDVAATKQLLYALKMVDVKLIDHMVFAQGDYTSMRQSAKYGYVFLGGDDHVFG